MSSNRPGLEVHEDLAFQYKLWRVAAISWTVVLCVLVAAGAGLFGNGPFSRAVETGDGATVLYERIARNHSLTKIEFNIERGSGVEPLRVSINKSFFQKVELRRVDPEPVRVEDGGSHLTYVFSTTAPIATIYFRYLPDGWGKIPIEFRITGGPALSFSQFVYP
jgi:hypothetical protein